MNSKTTLSAPAHINWIDFARVVACFLVVLAHCCDPFVARFDDNPLEFLTGAAWGRAVRPCVPLFVMISGVLLLPVSMDTHTFYKKRLTRVVAPLVFWGIVTPIFYYLYVNSGVQSTNLNLADYTTSEMLAKILTFPLNFNYDIIPLWYLYMLIGLYLFMPIITPWLQSATKKDLKLFLYIWGFTMVVPYLQMAAPLLGYKGNYGNMGLFGVVDWNAFGTFYYFSGFLGYLVLAFYLKKYPLGWSWGKTWAVAAPLYIVGYCITYFGFVLTQRYYPGSYAQLEIIWYFYGLNVFMMTIAAYIVLMKVNIKNVRWAKAFAYVAKLTFGIYLCHFLLVQIGYDFVYNNIPVAPALQIPIIAVLAFTASAIVVLLLSKLPKSKYIIG
ncbi:MAG: acyltransferase [Tannerellaceae bacterium]